MRTAQLLLFYLLKWCQTAESLTDDKEVVLGRNVTLDCQIDNKEIYWFFLKQPDSLVIILRTFGSTSTSAFLEQERFKEKYSSLTLSRLFIRNISIDEIGIYYCVKAGVTTLKLGNGTRLYITENTAQDQNQTQCNEQQLQSGKSLDVEKILIISSFLLNIMLIIAVTGLIMRKRRKPTKSCQTSPQHRQNDEPVPLEDLNAVQYSEIEFPACSSRANRANRNQINGTYALLEMPKPHP